jgi:hypothetical protein
MTTATASTLKLTKIERDTLRALVRRLLQSEHDAHAEEVPGHGKELSERELDLRDWGITYGLAVGVLAVEKPLADPEERAKVAHSIAVDVYIDWGVEIARRPDLGRAINDVLAANASDGQATKLQEAMADLHDAWGAPQTTNGQVPA